MTIKYYVIGMALLITVSGSKAQPSSPEILDLNRTISLVIENHPAIKQAEQSAAASGEMVAQKQSAYFPEIEALEEVEIIRREFRPDDLHGRFLVISATNDRSVNEEVARTASRRSMLVNVVDVPELCNFYVNAQMRCFEKPLLRQSGR